MDFSFGDRNFIMWFFLIKISTFFLLFLKEAENPLPPTLTSEWNFTNILLPVDLTTFGTVVPQNVPKLDDVSSPPSLISTKSHLQLSQASI